METRSIFPFTFRENHLTIPALCVFLWLGIFSGLIYARPESCRSELEALKQLDTLKLSDFYDFNLIRSELGSETRVFSFNKLVVFVVGDHFDRPLALINQATLYVFIRNNGEYQLLDQCGDVYVGWQGFSAQKREGDKKTPIGVYQFGEFFTNLDYFPDLQGCEDSLKIWGIKCGKRYIRSVDSLCCYDGMVNEIARAGDRLRYLPGDFKGNGYVDSTGRVIRYYQGENLAFLDYRRCALINYNYGPGRSITGGSAILFHVDNDSHKTSGCIALQQNDMERVFPQLYPGEYLVIADTRVTAGRLVDSLQLGEPEKESLRRFWLTP